MSKDEIEDEIECCLNELKNIKGVIIGIVVIFIIGFFLLFIF
jgi:hypothetical protein